MAKPSTAPVAASCAEPTSTGGVCGPALSTIREALAARVWSNEAPSSGPDPAACCGNASGSVSGPVPAGSIPSPEKLSRAVAAAVPLLTSVNAVVQFSSAARCDMEPIKESPGMVDDCSSAVNVTPPMLRESERSPPVFGDTSKVTVPFPVPDDGLVGVSQVGRDSTVHGQLALVVILIVSMPP